jgi:hypothetical protein
MMFPEYDISQQLPPGSMEEMKALRKEGWKLKDPM